MMLCTTHLGRDQTIRDKKSRPVVSADDEEKLLEAEFWPSGVRARRWFGNDRGKKIRMRPGDE